MGRTLLPVHPPTHPVLLGTNIKIKTNQQAICLFDQRRSQNVRGSESMTQSTETADDLTTID